MGWWTHSKQTRQINEYDSRIREKYRQINSARQRIASLKHQLAVALRQKDVTYAAKEVARGKINVLKKAIAAEEAKLPPLIAEYDRLVILLEELQAALGASNEAAQAAIVRNEDTGEVLTSATGVNNNVRIAYYNDIQLQNKTLSQNIVELKSLSATYDAKTIIENNNATKYEFYVIGLMYVYYVALVALLYIVYSKLLITNKYIFVAMAILLGAYPFYILAVEQIIFNTLAYTWALMRGEPYVEK
mgnify:CR=1 FL=1